MKLSPAQVRAVVQIVQGEEYPPRRWDVAREARTVEILERLGVVRRCGPNRQHLRLTPTGARVAVLAIIEQARASARLWAAAA